MTKNDDTDRPAGYRILLIDDEESIHEDYRKVLCAEPACDSFGDLEAAVLGDLAPAGAPEPVYQVDSAEQGEAGLKLVEAAAAEGRPYSVMFVDMRMPPGWDGIETIERIWKVDPEIQAVICTAYSDYSWAETVQRLGRNDRLLILKKPFDMIEVMQLACALSEKWTVTRTLREQALSLLEANDRLRRFNERLELEIGARREAEDRLRHRALHDALTDLPNRALLIERIDRAIVRGKRDPDFHYAVLSLDVDRFKAVNDMIGHRAGDELLVEIARRLEPCVRSIDTAARPVDDTTARVGGDEFVVLLDGLQRLDDAVVVGERLLRAFDAPFEVGGTRTNVSASLGIALARDDYDDPHEMLRDADNAMHEAKAQGRGRSVVFTPEIPALVRARTQLERDLPNTVERRQLRLQYQPLVALTTARIDGFEALARWQHPVRGLIPPNDFIPLAEETGLIIPIGRWVLEEGCHQAAAWQRVFPASRAVTVSVNVAGRQLREPEFAEQVVVVVEAAGIDPAALRLEVDASTLEGDPRVVRETLHSLHRVGVGLTIDDFGRTRAAEDDLDAIPVDMVKIDQSLVRDMVTHADHMTLIERAVASARQRDIRVVAVGVETVDQLNRLRDLGVDVVQGAYFAKAQDPENVATMLAAGDTWRSFEPKPVMG